MQPDPHRPLPVRALAAAGLISGCVIVAAVMLAGRVWLDGRVGSPWNGLTQAGAALTAAVVFGVLLGLWLLRRERGRHGA